MYKKSQLKNSIIEGECLEKLKLFPSSSVDMVLCDLPYGTTQNKWDSIIDLDLLWSEYDRILKENSAVVLFSQGIFTAKLILSNSKYFKYKYVWEKSKPTNFLNAKKQPLRKHEDICVFYKKQPIYNPQMTPGKPYNKGVRKSQLSGSYGDFKPVEVKSNGERYPVDILYFKTAESEGEVFHPTQKPIDLLRFLLRTYTKEKDLVLDNTFGSGSTLVACALENRFFSGIELNKENYRFKERKLNNIKIAKNRIININPKIQINEL
ncbi:site-specific DNA-methyltransferase [Acidimicrobiia bacterium]|nr:site-specific DNA-methyltransferase [Acidimicrobiia bacterium]